MMTEDSNSDLKYAEEFARLAEELHRAPHEQPTLERIAALAVETIDACDYCGISVRQDDGRIVTPAATDEIAIEADRLQYKFTEGPCVDSIWHDDSYLIQDLTEEARWPRWTPAAVDLGIGSILSVQLESPGGRAVAAINLYAAKSYAFDSTDVAVATIFSRHASTALNGARAQEGMSAALRSRQTIGVAQGILMQRYGITLDQSFELLRRYSRDHNIKLRVLAENLVRTGRIPLSSEGGGSVEESLGLGGETAVQD